MFKVVDKCRCCGQGNLYRFMNLGQQPLANNFHKEEPGSLDEFPLEVNVCGQCFHSQLSVSVDRELMFDDYVYRSGTSTSLRHYFNYLAELIDFNTPSKDYPCSRKLLDIGCNDDTFMNIVHGMGWDCVGVDPAVQFDHPRVNKSDPIHVRGYWSSQLAEGFGQFDVVTALNVFAHTDDLDDFLEGVGKVLAQDGTLYIQTSQRDWIQNCEFDTVYHEHQNFFTVSSMGVLLDRHGFIIDNIDYPEVHGGSYLFAIRRGIDHTPAYIDAIHSEYDHGLYDLNTYRRFGKYAQETIEDLQNLLDKYSSDGWKIIGYGAAAKGNTLINASDAYLEYIIDDNDWKQGLLSPGGDTPVIHPTVLNVESGNLLVVILAWNMRLEIIKKVMEQVSNDVEEIMFLTVFPNIRIEGVKNDNTKK